MDNTRKQELDDPIFVSMEGLSAIQDLVNFKGKNEGDVE